MFLKHTESEVVKFLKLVLGNKFSRKKNLYILNISNQKEHSAAQPITLEFNSFDRARRIVTDHTAFALVLASRLVGKTLAGRQMFDLQKNNQCSN